MQSEIARVIALVEKDGLNCKNVKERRKSNQHERNWYETVLKWLWRQNKKFKERTYKAQSHSINICHQHLVSYWIQWLNCLFNIYAISGWDFTLNWVKQKRRERSRCRDTVLQEKMKRSLGVPCLLSDPLGMCALPGPCRAHGRDGWEHPWSSANQAAVAAAEETGETEKHHKHLEWDARPAEASGNRDVDICGYSKEK